MAQHRTAPAVFNGIAHGHAARWLAYYCPIDLLLAFGQLGQYRHGTMVGIALLIGGNQITNTTPMIWVVRHKPLAGDHHGGETALHVGGTATIEHAIAFGRHEGWRRPVRRVAGRHHIGMAGKDQKGRTFAVGRPEVIDILNAHRLINETVIGQSIGHDLLATPIIGCY